MGDKENIYGVDISFPKHTSDEIHFSPRDRKLHSLSADAARLIIDLGMDKEEVLEAISGLSESDFKKATTIIDSFLQQKETVEAIQKRTSMTVDFINEFKAKKVPTDAIIKLAKTFGLDMKIVASSLGFRPKMSRRGFDENLPLVDQEDDDDHNI